MARIPASVSPYYSKLSGEHKQTMLEMRIRILEVIPGAKEIIKYGMPTFLTDEGDIAGLLANKAHIGYYPYSGSIITKFPELVSKYKTTKGALHVPLGKPLLKGEVKKLVNARIKQLRDK